MVLSHLNKSLKTMLKKALLTLKHNLQMCSNVKSTCYIRYFLNSEG